MIPTPLMVARHPAACFKRQFIYTKVGAEPLPLYQIIAHASSACRRIRDKAARAHRAGSAHLSAASAPTAIDEPYHQHTTVQATGAAMMHHYRASVGDAIKKSPSAISMPSCLSRPTGMISPPPRQKCAARVSHLLSTPRNGSAPTRENQSPDTSAINISR